MRRQVNAELKGEPEPERADDELKEYVDQTKKDGDTLGGIVEVRVIGLPFGLGTHAQWDRKLDGRLAQAVMADAKPARSAGRSQFKISSKSL